MIAWNFQKTEGTCQFRVPWFEYPCGYSSLTIKPKFIEISGHATEPVVCHALSAISNMVANYIADHGWGRVTYGDGYLKITGMRPERYNDPLLEAFKRAIIDIANEYPGNIIIKSNLDTFS